jgi:hypothetical protein
MIRQKRLEQRQKRCTEHGSDGGLRIYNLRSRSVQDNNNNMTTMMLEERLSRCCCGLGCGTAACCGEWRCRRLLLVLKKLDCRLSSARGL